MYGADVGGDVASCYIHRRREMCLCYIDDSVVVLHTHTHTHSAAVGCGNDASERSNDGIVTHTYEQCSTAVAIYTAK